ncbi:hypothetical protein SDC9_168671 [bioreactor metagenome]|uniref:Uncharacterized protein n=1 Tax=bioreactor metagenome TaxID=1076179 RepID=A0A645G5Q0_9ZZZZ
MTREHRIVDLKGMVPLRLCLANGVAHVFQERLCILCIVLPLRNSNAQRDLDLVVVNLKRSIAEFQNLGTGVLGVRQRVPLWQQHAKFVPVDARKTRVAPVPFGQPFGELQHGFVARVVAIRFVDALEPIDVHAKQNCFLICRFMCKRFFY